MPRSAGTYTLPANSLAVSGTTISSTYFNAALNDIASELTASVPRDGTGAMTGKLAGKSFDADAITTVASATTTDIGAAATREVTISGTTTITAFSTAAAGIRCMVRFSGALTLTHNATTLILPGAVNILTAANDCAEFLSLGSGNWICTAFTPRAGAGMTLISSGTASAAATLDITLPAGYRAFRLLLGATFYPSTDATALALRVSYDSGSTFQATAYAWAQIFTNTQAAQSVAAQTSADASTWTTTAISLSAFFQDNVSTGNGTYIVDILQGSGSYTANIRCSTFHNHSSGSYSGFCQVAGLHGTTDTIDAIRLLYNSGNLNGPWALYGTL